MKRNLFGWIAAVGVLFATSCAKDAPEMAATGDEAVVSFALGLENSVNTRAISDGTGADMLVYQLYDANGEVLPAFEQVVEEATFPHQLTLRLIKGQTYKIAFWAQNSECKAYNTDDLTAVTVDYNGVNNDETRDAFFSVETFTVSGQPLSSTLRRPFAQLNLGATVEDYKAALAAGFNIVSSKVVINKVPTTLNLLTGETADETAVTYEFGATPTVAANYETETEMLNVKVKSGENSAAVATDFAYLSMSYVLAPAEKTTLDNVTFTLRPENGDDIVISQGLTAVPIQRNWRTNVLGSFLTTEQVWNIIIDPEYNGDYTMPEDFADILADGVTYKKNEDNKPVFRISSAAGLKWFADAVGGKKASDLAKCKYGANNQSTVAQNFANATVVLTNDIDLSGSNWTPISSAGNGFNGTFDGGNNTISNMTVVKKNALWAGLFESLTGSVKDLKMQGVNITAAGKAGAIAGGTYGNISNCHVTNATITITAYAGSDGVYDEGNDLGGIVGFLRDGKGRQITDCSVTNATLTGFRSVGGIVGKSQNVESNITGNTVSNVKIIGNLCTVPLTDGDTYNYKGFTEDYLTAFNAVMADPRTYSGSLPATYDETGTGTNGDTNTLNNVTITVIDSRKTVETGDLAIAATAAKNGCDISITGNITATPDVDMENGVYGKNSAAIIQNGGEIDGNGNTLKVTNYYTADKNETFGVYTSGGTIKNLNIGGNAFRGLYIAEKMTEDLVIEGCVFDAAYALNTAGSNYNYSLTVKDSEFVGWSSWAALTQATFTNVKFKVGKHFSPADSIFNRMARAYITTRFEECDFEDTFALSLPLKDGCKVTFKNCRVNGETITAENIMSLFETVELHDNTSVTDWVIFE